MLGQCPANAAVILTAFHSHVKKSADFIHKFELVHAGPQDIMISFDEVSLFIRVPVRKAVGFLGQHFEMIFCGFSTIF